MLLDRIDKILDNPDYDPCEDEDCSIVRGCDSKIWMRCEIEVIQDDTLKAY